MCVDTVDHAKPHPHHVDAEVSWPVTEHERELGNESEEHAVSILVLPEYKMPKARGDGTDLVWSLSDQVHPFWVMKRMEKADPDNMALTLHTMLFLCTNEWEKDKHVKLAVDAAPPTATAFTVQMPVLTNSRPIKADTELILKWHVEEKTTKTARGTTWVDEVGAAEKKRRTKDRK